jgi:NADH-quinone oxidoreductase subunit C
VARLFQRALPGVQLEPSQTPIDEAISVQRDDFRRVMEAAKNHPDLAFDFLRCVSGVDWLTELESVYMLRSMRNGHSILVKVRCPYEDPHVPTVSDIWESANWLERETHEMFGIVYDGHPDLRPLLTEEGLGYYILRKSHPLASIEEWQENYLQAIEEAQAQAAAAGGPPVVDEKAAKIAAAQAKAAIITKTRADARAKGLSPEDEKAAVAAALAKWEEEQAAQGAAPTAGTPADPKAAKIQQAQAKAKIITKAREEARAKGLTPEQEREFVAEALKKFSEESGAAPPAAPPPAAAPQTQASKIQLAQAKAKLITKTREEARAKGLSPEEERAAVAEALKKFAEEQGG